MDSRTYILSHFGGFWKFAQSNPLLRRKLNRLFINSAIYKTATRPYPITTLEPCTSWESLTDRTYSSRHLPPVVQPSSLPDPGKLAELFMRRGATILRPEPTVRQIRASPH